MLRGRWPFVLPGERRNTTQLHTNKREEKTKQTGTEVQPYIRTAYLEARLSTSGMLGIHYHIGSKRRFRCFDDLVMATTM